MKICLCDISENEERAKNVAINPKCVAAIDLAEGRTRGGGGGIVFFPECEAYSGCSFHDYPLSLMVVLHERFIRAIVYRTESFLRQLFGGVQVIFAQRWVDHFLFFLFSNNLREPEIVSSTVLRVVGYY